MKTALLCPGPSLVNYVPSDHAIVAGVNRAVVFAPCDFFVFLDDRPFKAALPTNEPCLVTSDSVHRYLVRKQFVQPSHTFIDRRRLYFDGDAPWGRFSSTNALILLANLGATSIECFGVDMAGTLDWDEHSFPQDKRDDKRWNEEAGLWRRLVEYLAERGCVVTRMGVTCAA